MLISGRQGWPCVSACFPASCHRLPTGNALTRPPLLCSRGPARLLSAGISSLLIALPLLIARKGNRGFAGKAKCTSHSLAERWVMDARSWGDASLQWLSRHLDAPMGAAVGPLQGPAAPGSRLDVSDHCSPVASEPPAPGAGAAQGCRLTQGNTENPAAAASHWVPACLEELSAFCLLCWSPSFPWYLLLDTSVSSSKAITQLLGSTPGSQIQTSPRGRTSPGQPAPEGDVYQNRCGDPTCPKPGREEDLSSGGCQGMLPQSQGRQISVGLRNPHLHSRQLG